MFKIRFATYAIYSEDDDDDDDDDNDDDGVDDGDGDDNVDNQGFADINLLIIDFLNCFCSSAS